MRLSCSIAVLSTGSAARSRPRSRLFDSVPFGRLSHWRRNFGGVGRTALLLVVFTVVGLFVTGAGTGIPVHAGASRMTLEEAGLVRGFAPQVVPTCAPTLIGVDAQGAPSFVNACNNQTETLCTNTPPCNTGCAFTCNGPCTPVLSYYLDGNGTSYSARDTFCYCAGSTYHKYPCTVRVGGECHCNANVVGAVACSNALRCPSTQLYIAPCSADNCAAMP